MNKISVWLMVLLFVAAGTNHFINPMFYNSIMPPLLPLHICLIYVTGFMEITFAILLIPASTRHIASMLIIALLILIFPANVYMSVKYWKNHEPHFWLTILRLPLQFVLIWWARKNGKMHVSDKERY